MLVTLAAFLLVPQSTDVWAVDVAVSARSNVVVVSCSDGTLRVLDADTGKPHEARTKPESFLRPWSVAIDPSGELVAALNGRCDLYLWSWRKEDVPARVARLGEYDTIDDRRRRPFSSFLEFSATGERLAAGVAEGRAVLVGRDGTPLGESGEILRDGEHLGGSRFNAPMAWSGDGGRLALLLESGPVVLDPETGARLDVTFDTDEVELRGLALDSAGDRLALGGDNLTAFLFDVPTGESVWQSRLDPSKTELAIVPHGQDVAWLSFSPKDDLLACTTAEMSFAGVLDAATGEHRWLGGFHGGRMGDPRRIAWTSTGDSFFHTYISGYMPLVETKVRRVDGVFVSAEEVVGARSSTPKFGALGLAVHIVPGGVRAFDVTTGEERWLHSL